jgi:hypothetical protein
MNLTAWVMKAEEAAREDGHEVLFVIYVRHVEHLINERRERLVARLQTGQR